MAGAPSSRNLWLTDRDRRMLDFMAEHRLVLERQVIALVGGAAPSVQERLRRLAGHRYVSRWRGFDGAYCCAIRARGLAATGSQLRPPVDNPRMYRHDVGVAWLWLAAQQGAFGPVAEVVGERRIRSFDMLTPEEPYAIRLGGYEADGRERRHYPDLVLVDHEGRRTALELELSPKQKRLREEILAGYGADRRVDGVLYLVQDDRQGRSIGRAVAAMAGELGVADRVRVRPLTALEAGRPGESPLRPERQRASPVAEAAR